MRELREAIIHLDGSEQNVKNLSLDIAPDIQQIGDDDAIYVGVRLRSYRGENARTLY